MDILSIFKSYSTFFPLLGVSHILLLRFKRGESRFGVIQQYLPLFLDLLIIQISGKAKLCSCQYSVIWVGCFRSRVTACGLQLIYIRYGKSRLFLETCTTRKASMNIKFPDGPLDERTNNRKELQLAVR